MKLSDLRSADTVHREDLANDPDYRREYLETSFANQVAIQVIRWRTEHGLTQAKLAELLGMRQPNVARLEAGEHTPSLDTLSRLSSGLGLQFNIGINPDDGIHLDGFRPHAEIRRRTTLDLDEGAYAALREAVVDVVARLGQRQPADEPDTTGAPAASDTLFRDPADGIIIFLAGFPGHQVDYLEVATGSPQVARG